MEHKTEVREGVTVVVQHEGEGGEDSWKDDEKVDAGEIKQGT